MNDYLISAILGVIEGITEFLPVSSTAHLRLAESLMHLSLDDGYWKMYSIVIQLGAVLCLPVYFRSRIVFFLKSFLSSTKKIQHPLTLVTVAFVLTAIPSFLLIKLIGQNLENLHVMAYSLIIGGIVMVAVDLWKDKNEKAGEENKDSTIKTWRMEDMSMTQAVIIGLCQNISAVFPGTSRSMATIVAGQLAGLSRAAALEFSFFLSMPTMGAATLYVLLKSLAGHDANPVGIAHLTTHQWGVLALGFVISFAVAYAAVAFLMNWVRTRSFIPFGIYRVMIGVIILAVMA